MTIAPGRKLGPYEVLSPLGAGGMGEVYKAKDTRLDRSVALKVLPSELARDPSRRARLEREAKAISQLDHAHIWWQSIRDIELLLESVEEPEAPRPTPKTSRMGERLVWAGLIALTAAGAWWARPVSRGELTGSL